MTAPSTGTTTVATRCIFRGSDYFETGARVLGWEGPDGGPTKTTSDRLATPLVCAGQEGRTFTWGPLSVEGFEDLSLDDATVLGFTSAEYQAGLRSRWLRRALIQSEQELAAELLPPEDKWEAEEREGAGDWEEWNPVRRVPYPADAMFDRHEVIGWAADEVDDSLVWAEDRFLRHYLVRDGSTGSIERSDAPLRDVGLEALSMKDALILGFDTAEYQTALRVRILERRQVRDDLDMAESIMPPAIVRSGLNRHGRLCSDRIGGWPLWQRNGWEENRPLREWITRRERTDATRSTSRRVNAQSVVPSPLQR
ncbi:hypothetical protein ABIE78_001593 [Sinorhizobium fredii]|uniref:Uncharacterized protein n=1 Tax=Sinorhizobium fredii (strain USDA 257) TaxID=1185652 RepID=I3X9H0_SINF2|nr:hypothetical protein [Sinorhizobium fredii]AFL52526.1 hypothetical protein USDA257_c39820 [Sinorhizobium fredii USDA 257]